MDRKQRTKVLWHMNMNIAIAVVGGALFLLFCVFSDLAVRVVRLGDVIGWFPRFPRQQ